MVDDTFPEPVEPARDVVPPSVRHRGSMLGRGAVVGAYSVVRLLDRGGMGEVYLAHDVMLGRKVALKVIRPDQATSPSAIQRFLLEARATARLNHPHIVTIFGAGEHRGFPYVALELLEGQNLRDRLRERGERRALGFKETLRIGLAVARALEEAHRHDVLHLDLKPANVVMPRDGRPRVVDFGLARILGEGASEWKRTEAAHPDTFESGRVVGTPAYMAPEQWEELPPSRATDVWALGVMLFEMCTGIRPFLGESLADLVAVVCNEHAPSLANVTDAPRELSDLVERCLKKQPDTRPSAGEIAEALQHMLATERRAVSRAEGPFRGLLPFTEKHADLFYGREAEVDAFVERARLRAILPVVGPSGSGKSSFVEAGVIPRLREQHQWLVLALRPGSRPFRTLASRVLQFESASGSSAPIPGDGGAAETPSAMVAALAEQLRAGPSQLSVELRALAEARDARVLLLVDQLEELFTLVDDYDVRRDFMRAICTAADDPEDPVRVVFTVRDDFLGRIATDAQVRDVLTHVTVIQNLEAAALERTLLAPLEVVGYAFEDPKMVVEMTDAVRGSPAGLALLQFAAQRLWEERDEGAKLLVRSVFDSMGGVEGALARHADGVLDGLSFEELALARTLLLRLVTADGTRKVVSTREALDGIGDGGERLVSRLIAARLLTVKKTREDGRGRSMLELAHESLIRSWRTLARWLEESHDEVFFLTEVGEAAERWDRRGRRKEELYRGAQLAEALRDLKQCTRAVPDKLRNFVTSADGEERRRVRWRRIAIVSAFAFLGVVAVAAILASLLVSEKEREARKQRDNAEEREAEALIESAREAYASGHVLEARAKLRKALEIEDSTTARALWWDMAVSPLVLTRDVGRTVYGVEFSPDSRSLAVAAQDGLVYLFDTRTGGARQLRGHTDQVLGVTFSPDGSAVASVDWSGVLRLWDVESATAKQGFDAHTKRGGKSIDFSPDGKRLVIANRYGFFRILDATTGKTIHALDRSGHQWYAAEFSPDGRLIATAEQDNVVALYDAHSGESLARLEGREAVRAVAFSPDGTRLASGGDDRIVRIWDVAAKKTLRELARSASPIARVAFSPDGGTVASTDTGTLRLWDAANGTQRRVIQAHDRLVSGLAFSPDGTVVATGSDDGRVRVWSTHVAEEAAGPVGHSSSVLELSFDSTSEHVATASTDNTVRVWEVGSGRESVVLSELKNTHVRFVPGEASIVTVDGNAILLVDLATGARRELQGHGAHLKAIALSRDGKLLASAANDGELRLWHLPTGARLRSLSANVVGVHGVAFNHDATLLAVGGLDGAVRVWDLPGGDSREAMSGGHGEARGVAFDRGHLLAAASNDGSVRILDLDGNGVRELSAHKSRAYGVAFDPAGARLATASADRTVRIHSLADGSYVELLGHSDEANSVSFSPDGQWIATAGDDGTLRMWNAATARPTWRAPLLLRSPPTLFSQRGWRSLDDDRARPPPPSRWREQIERRARAASEPPASLLLCILLDDGAVQLWDRADDRLLAEHELVARQVLALGRGCAVRTDTSVQILTRDGELASLVAAAKPSTMGRDGDGLVVATGVALVSYDAAGAETGRRATHGDISAVARSHDAIIVGYADGNLTRFGGDPEAPPFRDVPASQPLAIVEGPNGTLAVGYGDGTLGIWDQHSGARLRRAKLHGQVIHLMPEADKLYAATDLGSYKVWQLRALHLDYCALMREVWERVPVVWHHAQASLEEPPPNHPCRER